jgi:hypothetical protein
LKEFINHQSAIINLFCRPDAEMIVVRVRRGEAPAAGLSQSFEVS